MNLFVPGRVCLFGEHSDWSGGHRRTNADILPGCAIIAGTNQGLHAEVKPHPSRFIFRSTLPDGTVKGPHEMPMDADALLDAARAGDFFSYAAGVAYQVVTHYRVRGLEIDNYRTDLPVKKGLSSSAAVCVLVARAFNRTYDLKMTTRGEMEIAYMGEITTPSRCGRLDQGCAYGNRPVHMVFDGDRIDVKELSVPRDIHFVLVDLHAKKDTREILARLNRCYPFPEGPLQRAVHEYLGPINQRIVAEAGEALSKGDAQRLGELMREAQVEFDKHLQPACPSQLAAPVLHMLLNYPALKPLVYGGKGVGSQGDGSAQFVVKDAAAQERVIEIVEKDLGMSGLRLTLQATRGVRKAVIPAAGFGTRLFPATKAVKKELFPVIDRDGRTKPAILVIVEEALAAGIEEVAIVVQNSDRDLFEEIFGMPPPVENLHKLSREMQKYCDYLMDIGHRITFLTQDTQEGFGHAVYCAKQWVGDEPFLLLLGDHVYRSETDVTCAGQLLDAFRKCGRSVVGLKRTPGTDVRHYGCVTGAWQTPDDLLAISEFYEKPDPEYARRHLNVEGLPDDTFLTVFGQYVFKPKIFDYIEEHIRLNIRERGEFQLTSCMDRMRREDGFVGCLIRGRPYDIGNPEAYRRTLQEFGQP
jgi:UTP-glucose-1-phosphate uridylyltransferase/galactokinase